MTRLSQSPKAAARRASIVSEALECFMTKGFQGTSMQDILTVTNLSAGALYRYFPSKQSLIEAVVRTAMAELRAALENVIGSTESLEQAMKRMVTALEELDRSRGFCRVALCIWAEALLNEDLAAHVQSELVPLTKWFEQLAAEHQEDIHVGKRSTKQIAMVLMGILQGFVVQRALVHREAKPYSSGINAIFSRAR